MNKLILVLYAFLAVAKGQSKDLATFSNSVSRTDDYIKLNRLQYAQTLQELDTKMDKFKEHYTGRVNAINVQLDMVVSNIIRTEERLNPLELVNDFSKQCVVKYRTPIPTVTNVKTRITNCVNEASAQVTNMLSSAVTTRNTMQNYHTNAFEKEVKNCATKYATSNLESNYTSCVTTVITNTNYNTNVYQKSFNIQMDAAECTSNANIKRALDCSYTVQDDTLSKIAQAEVLINNCLLGKDVECKSCEEVCPDSIDLQVDYKNQTISNPFYGLEKHAGCLLLKLH